VQQQPLQQQPTAQPASQQAPQQVPPPFTAAPADAALALRITKLAEFTTRNGPAFENQVRQKQGANPEYAFLNNREGSDYYRWCLFCMPRKLSLDQALPEGWADAPPPLEAPTPGQALPVMPAEVSSGFAQVLQLLHGTQARSPDSSCTFTKSSASIPPLVTLQTCRRGTRMSPAHALATTVPCADSRARVQESIKASSAWFLACALHAAGMALLMLHRVQALPDFTLQLHVIFLVNDIFFSGCALSLAGGGCQMRQVVVVRNLY
jgi:Surp module